jgi:hypothetical protein
MFLRCTRRVKDGKTHEYWNLVQNRRLMDGRVVQRQVLCLGEINANKREAWRKTIEVQERGGRRQVALFPAGTMPADEVDAIRVQLSQLAVVRPRQWGACWLALHLWQQLELDTFWRPRLPPSREATPWLKVLKTLVVYVTARLIDAAAAHSQERVARPYPHGGRVLDDQEAKLGPGWRCRHGSGLAVVEGRHADTKSDWCPVRTATTCRAARASSIPMPRAGLLAFDERRINLAPELGAIRHCPTQDPLAGADNSQAGVLPYDADCLRAQQISGSA